MADFPTLEPQSRTYTPGSFQGFRTDVLSGDEIAVRSVNSAVNYRLRVGFSGLTVAQQNSIFGHYGVHNRFQPFDLPSTITAGGGFSFPSGYQWIYAGPPDVSYEPGLINVSVEFELVAPYLI